MGYSRDGTVIAFCFFPLLSESKATKYRERLYSGVLRGAQH